MYNSNKLKVRITEKERSLFAKENIRKDDILKKCEGKIVNKPTKTTLQINENKHLEDPTGIDEFINHSCEPNSYINFEDLTIRALRNIKRREEVTFNYLTTEWDMAEKFKCKCGSKHCLIIINEFKYLTLDQKKKLGPLLSPFLNKKLKEAEATV